MKSTKEQIKEQIQEQQKLLEGADWAQDWNSILTIEASIEDLETKLRISEVEEVKMELIRKINALEEPI